MNDTSSTGVATAVPPPTRADAAAELLLRPERYFEARLRPDNPAIPWLVISVCGLARGIDSLDTRILMGTLATDSPLLTTWAGLWGGLLGAGVMSGLLMWLVGGWWYRMRLLLSGASDVNKRKARIVYTHAALVVAVPSVSWMAIVTFLYPNYSAAFAETPLAFALMFLAPWSAWVSYRGARHCFDVRPGRARVWFLILPLILYGAVFGASWFMAWFGPF